MFCLALLLFHKSSTYFAFKMPLPVDWPTLKHRKSSHYLLVLVKLGGYVQHVLVGGQRHGERVALDDAVQRELFHFQRVRDVDQRTHAGHHVGHDGRRLGVDNRLAAARQSIQLPLGVTAGRHGGYLLHAGNVLAAAVSKGLPQVLQTHVGRAWKTSRDKRASVRY